MDESADFKSAIDKNQEQAGQMMDKLLAAARPDAVFGQPTVVGDNTIITASEVTAGGGFGSGFGFGRPGAMGSAAGQTTSTTEGSSGAAGGSGGGGGSASRPVAVIVVNRDGVEIKPVFDMTKIALAGITAWGAIAIALVRMARANKD